jgi:MFS family permease
MRKTMQPTPLTPQAREKALRISIYEGALATVFISITTNGLVTGLALYLGAGPFVLGILGALPFLTQLMQLVGAYLEEKTGNRRVLSVWSEALSRLMWIPVAILPLLHLTQTTSLTIFVVLQIFTSATFGISVNTWSSWMSDLVPPERRGRYFGIRNTVASFASMVAGLASGYALDYFKRTADEGVAYAVTLGAGLVFAAVGIVLLRLQAEPPMQRRPRIPVREMFSSPLRDPAYRSLIVSGTIWAFVVGIAGPFFNAYGIENLKMSFADLAYMGIVTSVASMVVFPLVGRLQDRFGDRIVMLVSAACVVPLPIGWILSEPGFLWPLFGTSLGAGLFWPGINQGLANMSMARSPENARGAFIATYGAVTGIGVVVSGLAGGVIAEALRGMEFDFVGMQLNHYSVLFIGSIVMRLLAVVFVMGRLR